jgi:hypothetical protein
MFTLQSVIKSTVRLLRDENLTALIKEEDYIDAVNEAAKRVATELRIEHKKGSIQAENGVQYYELPADWLDFFQPYVDYETESEDPTALKYHRVNLVPYATVVHKIDLETRSGIPGLFWINGNSIGFYPKPAFTKNHLMGGDAESESLEIVFYGDALDSVELIPVLVGNAFGEDTRSNDFFTFDYYNLPAVVTELTASLPFQQRFFEPLTYLTAAILSGWQDDTEKQLLMTQGYYNTIHRIQSAGSVPLNDHNITAVEYFGG